jgi:hypothetical protein
MQKLENQICCGKRRKIKWWIFGKGENKKKCKWWKKGRKIKYEITTGLISQRERHILSSLARSSPYLED